MLAVGSCQAQEVKDIRTQILELPELSLPVTGYLTLPSSIRLNSEGLNELVYRVGRPKYIDTANVLQENTMVGLYPTEPFEYSELEKKANGEYEDVVKTHDDRVIGIGRLSGKESKTLIFIVKVITAEATYFDLLSISNDGSEVSLVPLYLGYRDFSTQFDDIELVNSTVTSDGVIKWHQDNRGLETFRSYELDTTGYFRIVQERQTGEYEY